MNPYAYTTVILIWGTTPLGVQWSAEGLSPFVGALLRVLIALSILLTVIRVLGIALPFHAQARRIYSAAILGQGLAMLMIYWASSYLPSGLVSLIFGFSPLLTGMLGWMLYHDTLSRLQLMAIFLGMAGLAITMSKNLLDIDTVNVDLHYFQAIACMFLACLCFSISNIWVKRLSEGVSIHPFAMATGSIVFALPVYIVIVLFDGIDYSDMHFTAKSAGAILYLSTFGSVLAPYFFYRILLTSSANVVALITVAAPVIAILLGALLNNEEIGLRVILGAVIVLVSLLLFQSHSLSAAQVKITKD